MEKVTEFDGYSIRQSVEDGIERISYLPKQSLMRVPLLLQHGMWHGAWVWSHWQEIFARAGIESHAYSLPGHGNSPAKRKIRYCTLGYYQDFLAREVDRLETAPVLIGHSMGGALVQRYLKFFSDELPAAVLLAPWTLRSTYADGFLPLLRRDPIGALMAFVTAKAFVRTSEHAAKSLIGEDALYSPQELFERLDDESPLVIPGHNPPFWSPKLDLKPPLLWIAGEKDAVITERGARKSAAKLGADYLCVPGAAHNLMVEASYVDTANNVLNWLEQALDIPTQNLALAAAGR